MEGDSVVGHYVGRVELRRIQFLLPRGVCEEFLSLLGTTDSDLNMMRAVGDRLVARTILPTTSLDLSYTSVALREGT